LQGEEISAASLLKVEQRKGVQERRALLILEEKKNKQNNSHPSAQQHTPIEVETGAQVKRSGVKAANRHRDTMHGGRGRKRRAAHFFFFSFSCSR
jgi:hypothetical protein